LFDPDNVDLWISTSKTSLQLLDASQPIPNVRRKAKSMMRASFLAVLLDLNQGDAKATAWGTDFSYDYVRINAEYST